MVQECKDHLDSVVVKLPPARAQIIRNAIALRQNSNQIVANFLPSRRKASLADMSKVNSMSAINIYLIRMIISGQFSVRLLPL